jgi:hypothetical protein
LEQLRILIVAMPRMLHEIVEATISSQPDMILTGPVRRSERIAAAARRVRADLVIVGESRDNLGQRPWQLLTESPRLKVLAISTDGHRATRYELRPHQMVIDNISPAHLVDAIRATATYAMRKGASRSTLTRAASLKESVRATFGDAPVQAVAVQASNANFGTC